MSTVDSLFRPCVPCTARAGRRCKRPPGRQPLIPPGGLRRNPRWRVRRPTRDHSNARSHLWVILWRVRAGRVLSWLLAVFSSDPLPGSCTPWTIRPGRCRAGRLPSVFPFSTEETRSTSL
jgi:hypothetical protein